MKKLGAIIHKTSGETIKRNIENSNSFFIVKYSGIASPDMSTLRQKLGTSKAKLFVVKNSVARKTLTDMGRQELAASVDGPCGFVFVKEEPVDASKILCNFLKDHEQLKLEGGLLADRILGSKDIEAMAKLPSKDVLRAQAVMALNAPLSKLVMVLNQTIKKFVICLDQVKQKKDAGANQTQAPG